jgi:hypothetical protein
LWKGWWLSVHAFPFFSFPSLVLLSSTGEDWGWKMYKKPEKIVLWEKDKKMGDGNGK